jgi:ribosomal protein L40E
MIDPEGYICDYYEINRDYLSHPPKMKFQNINFSKLSPEKKHAQVTISLMLNYKLIIKEKINWNLEDDRKSPYIFAKNFVDRLKDSIEPDLIEFNITNIKNQILEGLLEHIDKNTYIPKLRLAKKENENNQTCLNCDSVIFNQEYCVNCMFIFEKRVEKKTIEKVEPVLDEFRQTERQRILELRQKNVNIEDLALSYSETKDKKVCKKCGEINMTTAVECKNCKYKFPFITYFDKSVNQSYSVHFWDKINRNSTVQQLKNFGDFFRQEDFCSLKYLYNKIKSVIKKEFEEILTEEAYEDLLYFLEKSYFAFSNPTITTERVFDSAYYNKFSKTRPRTRMMNFNSLNDIREGWLNDTLPDNNVEELRDEKVRVIDPNLKKKRGRPKKLEIFKTELSKFNDIQITHAERDNLLKTDFIPEEDVHFDFCGKCEEEGKLICCETCSSAFHFECLGYDRV